MKRNAPPRHRNLAAAEESQNFRPLRLFTLCTLPYITIIIQCVNTELQPVITELIVG